LTGEFLYDPSFKLINSFGKGPELYEGILTILAPLKYGHKENNADVPANVELEINKKIRIINIFFTI